MKKRYKILTVIIVAVISVFLVGSLVLSRMAKSEFLITDIYNLSFRETAAFSNDDGLSYQVFAFDVDILVWGDDGEYWCLE